MAVQQPYEHYFRKVNANGTFKKTFKVMGLYFTISNCKVKKRISCGYSRRGCDSEKIWKAKQHIFDSNGGKCPHCGKAFKYEEMEMHHVLPVARFPELITNERNMLMLCHRCHKEVHCNPYREIRMMEAKAKEMGIDLNERYNRQGA